MDSNNHASTPTSITLADGKERHLRYSLGAVKRIKDKFGKTFADILGHPPEDFLPEVLMIGLVEKEGLTEQILLEDLLTGPMIEYAQLCFVESFFGQKQRQTIDALLDKNRLVLQQALSQEIKQPPATDQVQ